jgi:hypothetical protein
MPSINCLTCGYRQTDNISERFVGRSVKCPQCRRRVDVVADASSAAIDFPIDDSPADQTVNAPTSELSDTKRLPRIEPQPPRQPKGKWITILIVGVAAFIAGLVASPKVPSGLQPAKEAQKPRPQQAAVNAPVAANARDPHDVLSEFLKENTNTGEWEEVKYWPPFSISSASHSNAILTAGLSISQKNGGDAYPDALKLDRTTRADQTLQFMRLKYRTLNEFGNRQIMDEVFILRGDQISQPSHSEEQILQWAWEDLQLAEVGVILPDAPEPWAEHNAVFGQNNKDALDIARRLQQKGAK